MRSLAVAMVVMALLLGAARLFTGIVYASDEATSFLVLKPVPDAVVERSDTPGRPRGRVLESDEGQLVFAPAYLAAMHATPWATPLLLLGAAGLAAARRRRGA